MAKSHPPRPRPPEPRENQAPRLLRRLEERLFDPHYPLRDGETRPTDNAKWTRRRIEALEGDWDPEAGRVLSILRRCGRGRRCRNISCRPCSTAGERRLTETALQLFSGQQFKRLTIVDGRDIREAGDLHRYDLNRHVARVLRLLARPEFRGLTVMGMVDVSWNSNQARAWEPHWQPHLSLLVAGPVIAELAAAFRARVRPAPSVHQPCRTTSINEDLTHAISYAFKREFYARTSMQGGKTRQCALPLERRREILRVLGAHRIADRTIVVVPTP